eukprot:6215502-Prymnesium_polylepis.3
MTDGKWPIGKWTSRKLGRREARPRPQATHAHTCGGEWQGRRGTVTSSLVQLCVSSDSTVKRSPMRSLSGSWHHCADCAAAAAGHVNT